MMTTQIYIDGHTLVKPGLFHSAAGPIKVLGRTITAGGRCERVDDEWTPVVRLGAQSVWEGEVQSSHDAAERVARHHVDSILDQAIVDLFK